MAKRRTTSSRPLLDIPVSFGNVSVGDKTCRIGASAGRNSLNLEEADLVLCDKRLAGKLFCKPADEHPDQGKFSGMEDESFSGVFDVKGFGVSAGQINFGMTFAKKSVDVKTLTTLAKRSGRILIESSGEIPEPERGDPDEDNEEANGDGGV